MPSFGRFSIGKQTGSSNGIGNTNTPSVFSSLKNGVVKRGESPPQNMDVEIPPTSSRQDLTRTTTEELSEDLQTNISNPQPPMSNTDSSATETQSLKSRTNKDVNRATKTEVTSAASSNAKSVTSSTRLSSSGHQSSSSAGVARLTQKSSSKSVVAPSAVTLVSSVINGGTNSEGGKGGAQTEQREGALTLALPLTSSSPPALEATVEVPQMSSSSFRPESVLSLVKSAFPPGHSSSVVELIFGRFYWVAHDSSEGVNQKILDKIHVFCTDDDFVYEPFYADFGPLSLGQTYRYVQRVMAKLRDPKLMRMPIVHRTSPRDLFRSNAAYLACAYLIIARGYTPEMAWEPFSKVQPPFMAYRDATYGICTYKLSILDCLHGLHYAMKIGWFKFETFNIVEYEFCEKIYNGDMNWIIPNKFVAFSGPCALNSSNTDGHEIGCMTIPLEKYATIFKRLGVKLVIRLNKKQYSRKVFTSRGIHHVDLYFLDGSCPSTEIIDKFLKISENEPGAIAVHCKAGLGRTGTLIGCYAMKHYRFPPAAWIGWNRICRPGSVLGPQQYFMHEAQHLVLALGNPIKRPMLPWLTPDTNNNNPNTMVASTPTTADTAVGSMSPEERRAAQHGDLHQGDRLVNAKKKNMGGNSSPHNDKNIPSFPAIDNRKKS